MKLETIVEGITPLWMPGCVYELRVILRPGRTVSGYFDAPEALAAAAASWDRKSPGVYMTLNPVLPDLLARSANRVQEYARATTADDAILRRCWLPLDFDPVRPAGISSTYAEHDAAIHRAVECARWLTAEGVSRDAIILADSGNGAHLLVRVDLPNDDQAGEVLKRCTEAVALRFGDHAIAVDTTSANASRIWKIYGTHACKGDDIPDRPHRLAKLLRVPQ